MENSRGRVDVGKTVIRERIKRGRDQNFIYDMPGFDILGERELWKNLPSQTELFTFVDAYRGPEPLLLFAQQEPRWGNYSYVAATFPSFYKR